MLWFREFDTLSCSGKMSLYEHTGDVNDERAAQMVIEYKAGPDFWLVPAGFFVVQSIRIHRSDDGFDWMGALNSK